MQDIIFSARLIVSDVHLTVSGAHPIVFGAQLIWCIWCAQNSIWCTPHSIWSTLCLCQRGLSRTFVGGDVGVEIISGCSRVSIRLDDASLWRLYEPSASELLSVWRVYKGPLVAQLQLSASAAPHSPVAVCCSCSKEVRADLTGNCTPSGGEAGTWLSFPKVLNTVTPWRLRGTVGGMRDVENECWREKREVWKWGIA